MPLKALRGRFCVHFWKLVRLASLRASFRMHAREFRELQARHAEKKKGELSVA